jgi:hypothetical protein
MGSALAVALLGPAKRGPTICRSRTRSHTSDGQQLTGYIAKPEGRALKGPFPAVIWNHGSNAEPHFPRELAAVYLERGFVFFFPIRRYHKPNVKSETIMDLIQKSNDPPRNWCELQGVENIDVAAIGHANAISAHGGRTAVVGHERRCRCRATARRRAALSSRRRSRSRRPRCRGATGREDQRVRHRRDEEPEDPPVHPQAKNDFSLGPTDVLGPLLDDKPNLPHKVKQYPGFGGPCGPGRCRTRSGISAATVASQPGARTPGEGRLRLHRGGLGPAVRHGEGTMRPGLRPCAVRGAVAASRSPPRRCRPCALPFLVPRRSARARRACHNPQNLVPFCGFDTDLSGWQVDNGRGNGTLSPARGEPDPANGSGNPHLRSSCAISPNTTYTLRRR